MKITIRQLRNLIREAVEEAMSCIDEDDEIDQDKDGDNDFEDIKIARMKASGMPQDKAIKKVHGKS